MGRLQEIEPHLIEQRSFAIIEQEFEARTTINPATLDADRFQIIRRVIHATGDFSFAAGLVFHDEAIRQGVAALRRGRNICIDVGMGAAGINRSVLHSFGGRVICHINDPEIAETSRQAGRTRSETALRKAAEEDIGIIAVGNAPTALVAAMEMADRGEIEAALIVGVPVGFVNAEEAKELLMTRSYPFITNRGRKGGSPVAVAIINALLRLALDGGNR